jgi:hypothetical protein
MKIINSYSEFQPLEEIVVGRGYPPEYVDFVEDVEIRENLQKIFIEIEEDFENLIKTFESRGVTVHRPIIPTKQEFEKNPWQLPPLTPRDRQIVLGQKLVRVGSHGSFTSIIDHYKQVAPDQVLDPFEQDPGCVINGASASCIFRMGRDVWLDCSDWFTEAQADWVINNGFTEPGYRFHKMVTDGHSDCVFSILKPGVILTSFHDAGVAYQTDFPGWDMHRVQNPSMERFMDFRNELHPGATWWVPGRDNAPRFSQFVDQYLNEWTGCMHESVFDVNCVSIDEQHVVFACYNKEVFDYCSRHGIEPILCDLRHRFFFDGGTHCATLDIRRCGGMEDYFL